MQLGFFALLVAAFAAAALAVSVPQHAVIVSYPDNTPDSVLDEAKHAIKAAGGVVTHEYSKLGSQAATLHPSQLSY